MTGIDRLLGEFMDAWVSGGRPDPDAYIARAAPADREQLADGIDAFLERAPLPRYDEDALRALREDPEVQAFASGSWTTVLPRLRSRAGVDTPALAGALRAELGWDDDGERRAQEYLDGLETGDVPADRVSRRVLRVLAEALRVPAATLEAAATSLRPATGLLWRADGPGQDQVAHDLDVLSSMLSPAAAHDDVERAFTGGRDA